jgi:3-methyladenine DNA glycosylase AlkD
MRRTRNTALVSNPQLAQELPAELRAAGNPAAARVLQGFFKTGPGQYGEGDVFLGIKVPVLRAIVKKHGVVVPEDVLPLLHSRIHEERAAALFLWVHAFEEGDAATRKSIFKLYLANTKWINNWDLVDLTAPQIVGESLNADDSGLLDKLAGSKSLWERRISVVATLTFIRQGQFEPCIRMCRTLLNDQHDLMHKACGWMLREIGKRDRGTLVKFLEAHAQEMPRTMLRYSLEHFPESERRRWMEAKRRFVKDTSKS